MYARASRSRIPACLLPLRAAGMLALAAMLGACASHKARPPPDVPATLAVPGSQFLTLSAHGAGVQIYECRAGRDAPGQFAWTLKSPEADLLDPKGNRIGHHYAGPTWEGEDGSKVMGEVVAREESPRSEAIPWLLLRSTSNTGKRKTLFGRTQSIQRLHTVGGLAPTAPCDSSQVGKRMRIPYSADYYFYAARK
jgi:hypothetical protein